MPLARSRDDLRQVHAPAGEPEGTCNLCLEHLLTSENILNTECGHRFHNQCIVAHLEKYPECPECKAPGTIQGLHYSAHLEPQASTSKGAISKVHNTRSKGKPDTAVTLNKHIDEDIVAADLNESQIQDTQPKINSRSTQGRQPRGGGGRNRNIRYQPRISDLPEPHLREIDYDRIFSKIENLIQAKFDNLNLSSGINSPNSYRQLPSPRVSHISPASARASDTRSNTMLSTEKVTQIIQGWGIKYDGTVNGPTVQEFLYRVRTLTIDSLNGDFATVCKNLHVLLTSKAREWYWRYRKENPEVIWEDFCAALKNQYQDHKDDDVLMEEIRARKQKEGEPFDSFYEDIMSIVSRLTIPLDEYRLVQQLQRNLIPELRQALLYISIHSVAHLRQLVQKRENLLGDADFKQASKVNTQPRVFKRAVAAVETEESLQSASETESVSVEALQHAKRPMVCWNCDQPGHAWDMCLAERGIFCYGCGAKDFYKPQCPTCLKRAENSKRGSFADGRRMAQN